MAEHRIGEWSRAYLDYEGLKVLLEALGAAKAHRRELDAADGGGRDVEVGAIAAAVGSSPAVDDRGRALSFRGGSVSKAKGKVSKTATVRARWHRAVKGRSLGVHRAGDGTGDEDRGWVAEDEDEEVSPRKRASAKPGSRLMTNLDGGAVECGEEEEAFFSQLDKEVTKVNQFYVEQEGVFVKRHRDLLWQVDEIGRRRKELAAFAAAQEELKGQLKEAEYEAYGESTAVKAKVYLVAATNMNMGSKTRRLLEVSERFSRSKAELAAMERALKRQQKAVKDGFVDFMRGVYMLDAFRTLNMQGFEKILKKHDKIAQWNAGAVYLGIVNKAYFSMSTEIKHLKAESEAAYKAEFAAGDERQTRNDLHPHARYVNVVRVLLAGVFVGISVQCIIGLVLTMSFESTDDRLAYYSSLLPIFRGVGLLALHVAMFGGNVGQWEFCGINYPFIFNLSPKRMMNGETVELAGAVILAFVLFVAIVLSELYQAKHADGALVYGTPNELFSSALLTMRIVWALVILVSLGSFTWIQRTAWRIIAAWWTSQVEFGDFFTADQLTSQVQMLRDLVYVICVTPFNRYTLYDSLEFQGASLGVSLLPYFFRLVQCLRRWRDRDNRMDLVNAGKYTAALLAVGLGFQRSAPAVRVLGIVAKVVATEYALTWDLYVDWGLMRNPLRGQFLRPELWLSRKWTYYLAIVIDVVLRHFWILPMAIPSLGPRGGHFAHECWLTLAGVLEVLRRAMWNFFRIENEHLNNVEGYRAVHFVPLPFGERTVQLNSGA